MKLLLAFAAVLIFISVEVDATRNLEQLKEFEKYSPYPWTQWLRFHPSAAAAAAISSQSSMRPPPVFIPPIVDYDDSEEDQEDDEDDDLNDTVGPMSFLRRDVGVTTPAPADPKSVKAEAKLNKQIAKALLKAEKAAAVTTTKKPLVDMPVDFWLPPVPTSPNETLILPPGYYAAKKSMFVSKLFEALAKVLLNSTVLPSDVTASPTSDSPPILDDDSDEVLLSDVVRSIVEGSDEEEESSDEEVAEEEDPTTTEQAPTTTVPSILAKKLDFLGKLSALVSTTTAAPTKAPKAKVTPKPKPSSKASATKSKKLKPWTTPIVSTTTTTPSPVPAAYDLSYEALAKAILGLPE